LGSSFHAMPADHPDGVFQWIVVVLLLFSSLWLLR
jgi:hypothetical protein